MISIWPEKVVEHVYSSAFPVLYLHKETLFNEIQRTVVIGMLKKNSNFPYELLTCIIFKPDKIVWMVSDFIIVNYKLVRIHFPIPKIYGIMQELEVFECASVLDLIMW